MYSVLLHWDLYRSHNASFHVLNRNTELGQPTAEHGECSLSAEHIEGWKLLNTNGLESNLLFLYAVVDRYYSGEKVAPVPTVIIGGNHEASNHLQELTYGGWVAPKIYYLGFAGK